MDISDSGKGFVRINILVDEPPGFDTTVNTDYQTMNEAQKPADEQRPSDHFLLAYEDALNRHNDDDTAPDFKADFIQLYADRVGQTSGIEAIRVTDYDGFLNLARIWHQRLRGVVEG